MEMENQQLIEVIELVEQTRFLNSLFIVLPLEISFYHDNE